MKAEKRISKRGKADLNFDAVVAAFSKTKDVIRETRLGFGSGSLKVNGKIFAMISSKGEFVVKLPRQQVDELVRSKQGKLFDPGHGRLMKEWFVATGSADWLKLSQEAYAFVKKSQDKKV